ncbi:PTS system mannose/fructose/sorbose family transporter subunit IID [Pseudodesulfovibrio sp.]|uniref:PTS system mannose/fructose/sorbose family transporter subunit IID n=1 Tax=unclassified Pseudodesulfovibrio TaxID=2661612 RepID=UPI003AFFC546
MHPKSLHIPGAESQAMAFLRCFVRSYLSGTGFNTRGMQNIGLIFAMQPGLRAIYRDDPTALKAAYKRYAGHHQSHPFWAACLAGIFLNVELAIAAGRFPPKMLSKVKDTTSYTLSALGDSVFAGSMLIFWALLTICLLLSGQTTASLILGVAFFVALQVFRIYTFVGGLRQGFKFLERLKRLDLINWGRRVKYVNALLLLWLWILIWPRPFDWWEWLGGVAALMLFARFVRTGIMSRALAAAVFVVAIDRFEMVEQWIRSLL